MTNRVIKFRALKDDMSNCKWVFGQLVYDVNGVPRITAPLDFSTMVMTFHSCINGTECQFTGLIDKHGKEVFEGDVVEFAIKKKWCDCKPDVEVSITDKFCPSCGKAMTARDFVRTALIEYKKAGFYLSYKEGEGSYTWGFYAAENFIEWIEQIGDVYSNPELLTP